VDIVISNFWFTKIVIELGVLSIYHMFYIESLLQLFLQSMVGLSFLTKL